MPLRLGLIAYPLFALAIGLSRSGGTVSKFVAAQATSPQTARKPASIEVKNIDAVKSAVKRGLLIATGDGRYYVDLPRYRKRTRTITTTLIVIGSVLALGMLALFLAGWM